MNCSDLMTQVVYLCREEDTVAECARVMDERGVGFVPVVDESSAVIGTITDRDLALRVLAREKPFDTRVQEVMSTNPVACRPDDDLTAAEERMAEANKSRVVVVDEQNRCLGIVSLTDIAQQETVDKVGELLKSVSARQATAAGAD